MPIVDGKRYCVNHTNTRMRRTENFKALANVSGDAKTGKVDMNAGMIIMPFTCDECGYIELYVADKERLESKDA